MVIFWIVVYVLAAGITTAITAHLLAESMGDNSPDAETVAMAAVLGLLWPLIALIAGMGWFGYWIYRKAQKFWQQTEKK